MDYAFWDIVFTVAFIVFIILVPGAVLLVAPAEDRETLRKPEGDIVAGAALYESGDGDPLL